MIRPGDMVIMTQEVFLVIGKVRSWHLTGEETWMALGRTGLVAHSKAWMKFATHVACAKQP